MQLIEFATAFGAGIVSITSPCVLPLLPGVMAYSTEKSKLTPLSIVLGLTIAFTTMGVVSAVFSSLFFEYVDYIKLISGVLILIMGMYMLFEVVENAILRIWQYMPVSKVSMASAEETGLIGGLLLGISLGIVWIPCIGPMLAFILTLVAQQGSTLYGATLLLTYSLGLGIPMLAIAYSSNMFSSKVRGFSKYSLIIRRIAGVILVALGIYFITGTYIPGIS